MASIDSYEHWGKVHHLIGVPEPPGIDSPDYSQWEHDDLIVCSWMLDNMEPNMVHQYAKFPTAKDLWKGFSATYSKGWDGVQLFDNRSNKQYQTEDWIPWNVIQQIAGIMEGHRITRHKFDETLRRYCNMEYQVCKDIIIPVLTYGQWWVWSRKEGFASRKPINKSWDNICYYSVRERLKASHGRCEKISRGNKQYLRHQNRIWLLYKVSLKRKEQNCSFLRPGHQASISHRRLEITSRRQRRPEKHML